MTCYIKVVKGTFGSEIRSAVAVFAYIYPFASEIGVDMSKMTLLPYGFGRNWGLPSFCRGHRQPLSRQAAVIIIICQIWLQNFADSFSALNALLRGSQVLWFLISRAFGLVFQPDFLFQ